MTDVSTAQTLMRMALALLDKSGETLSAAWRQQAIDMAGAGTSADRVGDLPPVALRDRTETIDHPE